jgi:hypothetical protein
MVDMVYVDDAMLPYGRMKMSHLIATTDAELHACAQGVGVKRKWHQAPPHHDSHYDICLGMRVKAIERGAIPITYRQCGAMNMRRRITGELGKPEEAEQWVREYFANRRATNGNAD